MRIIFLLLLLIVLVITQNNLKVTNRTKIIGECPFNYRKNNAGICIPVEQCCRDDTCNPFYIAKPTYGTRVKKIVIPYAIFKRYPYSEVTECPKHFKKVNNKQCIHEIKTVKECPPTYFKVNRKTCLKVVSITLIKGNYFNVHCGQNQTLVDGKCIENNEDDKIKIDKIQDTQEEILCPKGYTKNGKFTCIKVLICPKGFKKTQTGCEKVKIDCPSGYYRYKNICKKLTKCPKGLVRRNKKCVKKPKCNRKKCPKVRCAKGFFKRYYKGVCCGVCEKCKCSKFFDPVCSTKGVTFRNLCDLKCQGFKLKHRGTCNKPCKGTCPFFIKPVCGSDGKTYRNMCVLRSNLVEFKYNGKCKQKIVKDPKDIKREKKIKEQKKKTQLEIELKKEQNKKDCKKVQEYLGGCN